VETVRFLIVLLTWLFFGRIYCGFEDAIEVFDVQRPGNDEGTRLHTTPSKKARDGLKGQNTHPFSPGPPPVPLTLSLNHRRTGIVSSIAFCPDQTNEYFAAGTLTPSPFNIAMFSESTGEKTLMWVGGEELRNSVSQVIFQS
jgi:telomerase Cajal body protein 1